MRRSKNLCEQLAQSPTTTLVVTAVAVIWLLVCVALVITTFFLYLERPGQALDASPNAHTPVIALEPVTGPRGTSVTVPG